MGDQTDGGDLLWSDDLTLQSGLQRQSLTVLRGLEVPVLTCGVDTVAPLYPQQQRRYPLAVSRRLPTAATCLRDHVEWLTRYSWQASGAMMLVRFATRFGRLFHHTTRTIRKRRKKGNIPKAGQSEGHAVVLGAKHYLWGCKTAQ